MPSLRKAIALAIVTFATAVLSTPVAGDWVGQGPPQSCAAICTEECASMITSYIRVTPMLTVTETIEALSSSVATLPIITVFPEKIITIYTTISGTEGTSTIPLSTSIVPASTHYPPQETPPLLYETTIYPETTLTIYTTRSGTITIPISTTVIPASTYCPYCPEETPELVVEETTIYPEHTVTLFTTISGPSGPSTLPTSTSIIPASTYLPEKPRKTHTIYTEITSITTIAHPIRTTIIPATTLTIYPTISGTSSTEIIPITTTIPRTTKTLYTTIYNTTTLTIPITTIIHQTSISTLTILSASTGPSTTETIPITTTIPATCVPDSCLKQMLASSAITSFCATYTAALNTTPIEYPSFASECAKDAAALSSACSCACPATTSESPLVLTKSVEGCPLATLVEEKTTTTHVFLVTKTVHPGSEMSSTGFATMIV